MKNWNLKKHFILSLVLGVSYFIILNAFNRYGDISMLIKIGNNLNPITVNYFIVLICKSIFIFLICTIAYIPISIIKKKHKVI